MGFYSPATLIHDAKRHGVEVRPPCMRDGQRMCTTEETGDPRRPALRVGWRYVHGIGEKALDALEAAWKARPFTSIEDVVRRAGLGRADALYLARADAFKAWEPDRRKAGWEALRCVSDTLPLAPARPAHHAPRPLDRDGDDLSRLRDDRIEHPRTPDEASARLSEVERREVAAPTCRRSAAARSSRSPVSSRCVSVHRRQTGRCSCCSRTSSGSST